MTQQSTKQQEFDAAAFELEHSKNFQVLQNTYINYEVDSIEEDFGELFRVWNERTLLGSFYENSQDRWIANPYYQDKECIKLDSDLSQSFDSSSQAVAYIQATYEGLDYISVCHSDDYIESVGGQSLVIAA